MRRHAAVGMLSPWPLAVTEMVVVAGFVLAVDWVFHNPVCDALFRCGCTWNWDGGWAACNVHNAEGPHCPWCEARRRSAWTTTWLVRAVAVLAYYWAAAVTKRRRARRLYVPLLPSGAGAGAGAQSAGSPRPDVNWKEEVGARLLVPPLAWLVACVAVGLGFFLANPDYPWFLFYTRAA